MLSPQVEVRCSRQSFLNDDRSACLVLILLPLKKKSIVRPLTPYARQLANWVGEALRGK